MFASIELWTVLGTWAQVVVLIVSACFVWRYLLATEKLVKTSVEQVEIQLRPAIIICVAQDNSLSFKNIGAGPAIDLSVAPVPRESVGCCRMGTLNGLVAGRSFVEPGEEIETRTIYTKQGCTGPAFDGLSLYSIDPAPYGVKTWGDFPPSVQCQYRSLSGRIYWTVADFSKDGDEIARSRFSKEELQ